jgi:hypothetical protein
MAMWRSVNRRALRTTEIVVRVVVASVAVIGRR